MAPKLVFVDGIDRIDVDCECRAVISGDALVVSIAAASIVAKVTRDRLMGCLGAAHPGYGFERHMGYSVPEHFAALSRLGPCVHHRRKFAPVAALLGDQAVVVDELRSEQWIDLPKPAQLRDLLNSPHVRRLSSRTIARRCSASRSSSRRCARVPC